MRTSGGAVITDASPVIWISQDLLDSADPRYLQHGEGLVRFTDSANRTLLYRLTGGRTPENYLVAEFVQEWRP